MSRGYTVLGSHPFAAVPPWSLKPLRLNPDCFIREAVFHPIFSPKQASTLGPSKSFTLESERRRRTYFQRMPALGVPAFHLEIPTKKMPLL